MANNSIQRIMSVALFNTVKNDFVDLRVFFPCACGLHMLIEAKLFAVRRFLYDAAQTLCNHYRVPEDETFPVYEKHGIHSLMAIIEGIGDDGYLKRLIYHNERINLIPKKTPTYANPDKSHHWKSALLSSDGEIQIANHFALALRHDGPLIFLETENMSSGFFEELVTCDNQAIIITGDIDRTLELIEAAREQVITQEEDDVS